MERKYRMIRQNPRASVKKQTLLRPTGKLYGRSKRRRKLRNKKRGGGFSFSGEDKEQEGKKKIRKESRRRAVGGRDKTVASAA